LGNTQFAETWRECRTNQLEIQLNFERLLEFEF